MASPSADVYLDVQYPPIPEPQPASPPDSRPTDLADQFWTGSDAHRHWNDPAPRPAVYGDAQRGMLVCCFTGRILIRVPGENYGDSSGRLWMMYLTEAEQEDKEITENWKGETDGILVFVSAQPYISSIYYI